MSATSDTAGLRRDQAPDTGQPRVDGRRGYRAALRAFRSRRTLAASLVATVLALVSILVVIEVISHLLDRPLGLLPSGRLAQLGRETQWNDPLTLVVATVLGLLGLLLVALAILPGRARVIPVAADQDEVILALRPTALERQAARAAEAVPGIDQAAASASRRRLVVRARTPLRDAGDLAEQVRQVVEERVEQFAPLRPPRVQVNLRHRRD